MIVRALTTSPAVEPLWSRLALAIFVIVLLVSTATILLRRRD